MRHKKENYINVPEKYKDIKQVILNDINDIYVLLETGLIWSRAAGKFLKTYLDKNGNKTVTLMCNGNLKNTTISFLVRKYFNYNELFKDVEYKPVIGLQDKYLALLDGRIYSLTHHKFLKPCSNQTGWSVISLVNNNGKRFSAFPAKLVYEAFKGPIDCAYKLVFKDNNKSNCNLNNLDIELKEKYKG